MTYPITRPFVHPETIQRERELNWPSFHPEDYCHRCGTRNIGAWWVDSKLWNQVAEPHEILCPQCFTEGFDEVAGGRCVWELRLDLRPSTNGDSP